MAAAFEVVPDWFSFDNTGAGIAVADRGTRRDLICFAVDNPVGQNQGFYRVARAVDGDGVPQAGWSSWLGVPNWFSWENQGASLASRVIGTQREAVVLMVDNPPEQNAGLYGLLALDEDAALHGAWEVLPYHSGVLAIHAATLPGGKVLFFAGSGNSQLRAASPDYGNMAKGVYTRW